MPLYQDIDFVLGNNARVRFLFTKEQRGSQGQSFYTGVEKLMGAGEM
jgi:hypothetical protein